MSAGAEPYAEALDAAVGHATRWLASQPDRRVGPVQAAGELAAAFGGELPRSGMPAADVVDYLVLHAEPGLMAMPSGRFFGWVIGGTLPAAMAADWLVSAWDQNSVLRYATPAIAAIEEAAGQWLLQLLGLPRESDVGFVTGATMANFTGLAAARWRLLTDGGWDVDRDGLSGAPRIHCLVGEERHDTIDLALRYLGLGSPTVVPSDGQGRIDAAELDCALDRALASGPAPILVCLQAGNLHSGAFDPFAAAVAVCYLIQAADGAGDPSQKVPELSRRARGVPVWAALRSLGSDGVAAQIRGLAAAAALLADKLSALDGVEVLNDVDFTQISVAFGDDATTRDVTARILADGKVWMSGSRWQGRDVLRISVSNWTTDADDVDTAAEAVKQALEAVRAR